MTLREGTERPLEAEEQALYEVVETTGSAVVARGAATLGVKWFRFPDQASRPMFELRPSRPDALPIAVSLGDDWIDATLDIDGEQLNFELSAETYEERLRRTRERIEAVIDGRVEVELRQSRGRFFRTWGVVARFHVAGGPDETSRSPCRPNDYGHLFSRRPGDEASGLLGPRRFAPYQADDSR